jgi:tetratricopeptide (TPR) repeat protein
MPGNAEQLEKQATGLYQKRAYLQAAELFYNAAAEYQAEQKPVRAAEMHNNRSVALLQAGDAAGALQAAAGTEMVFFQEGDNRRQAMALGNQAAALEELGKPKEALDFYQQASSLLGSEGESEMRSIILKRISSLKLRSGKALESLAAMDSALTIEKPASPKEKLLRRLLNFINRRI